MNPELMSAAIETAQAMRDIAKDKRRTAEIRVQAADTLGGILHSIGDLQHNVNDRIMAEQMSDMEEHDHGDTPWH